MASRSSQMPGTGAYSWSSTWMVTSCTRARRAGQRPRLGLALAEVAPVGGAGRKPSFAASVVT